MNRLLWYVLVVLIIFGIIWTYLFFLHTPKLVVVSNTNNINEFTYIPWWQIRYGWLERGLNKLYKQGKLENNSNNISKNLDFFVSSLASLEKNGFSSIGLKVPSTVSLDGSSKPYSFPAFFLTKLGNQEYVVIVQMWVTEKNEPRFVTYIYPFTIAQEIKEIKTGETKLTNLVNPQSPYFVMPLIQFRDLDFCNYFTQNATNFCKNIMKNNLWIKYVSKQWEKNNMPPQNMSRYPLWPMQVKL